MTNVSNTKQTTTPTTGVSTLLAGKDVKGFNIGAPMIDVRGWDVMGPDGLKFGSVDRIMLDAVEKKPRYLSITLMDRQGQYMLLPIGLGKIEPTRKQVLLNTLKTETYKAIPVLSDDFVTQDFERQVFGAVTGKHDAALQPAQWYADPVFDAAKLFGSKATVPTS